MDVRVGLWRKLSAQELMLLNCDVGEDSWESLGLQGDPTSSSWRKSVLSVHWKDWCEAETPILWPPDVKSWLFRKDPDAGKDWKQEEKGMTEDEIVGWHHRLNGHEFDQTPGDGDGQGSLVCCSPWGRKESDTTEWLNWSELYSSTCAMLEVKFLQAEWKEHGLEVRRLRCCSGSSPICYLDPGKSSTLWSQCFCIWTMTFLTPLSGSNIYWTMVSSLKM